MAGIDPRSLGHLDRDGTRVIVPGEYNFVWAGHNPSLWLSQLQQLQTASQSPMWLTEMGSGSGGEGEIRTPGTGLGPYDGLANRCFRPLSHLSGL